MRYAALLIMFCPIASQAEWHRGLRTGDSYIAAVTPSPIGGLEATMPRHGWYARGIEFDRAERWNDSYRAYRKAANEFRGMLRTRPSWRKTILLWIRKANAQRSDSSRLRRRGYYRYRRSPFFLSSSTMRYRAQAMHNKWLAIRAFNGRAPQRLLDTALADYRKALGSSRYYDDVRIYYAALLHEIGRHDEARAEFRKVTRRSRYWARHFAYYYTVAGNYPKAFEKLREAISQSRYNRRYILQSNYFDRLRGHPTFRKIVGDGPP